MGAVHVKEQSDGVIWDWNDICRFELLYDLLTGVFHVKSQFHGMLWWVQLFHQPFDEGKADR